MEFSLKEIDLCADWKDKYTISLQIRSRKYIYVWTFVWYYSHTRPTLAAFVSRISAIELIFPLDLTRWKWNSLQKNWSANAMVHITFIYTTMLVDAMSIVFVYQQGLSFKKTPIVSHYVEDCIFTRKKTKIKVIRNFLHKHTMISASIKE